MHDITSRIEREVGLPGLITALAEKIPASDLQSVLLEVHRRRAKARSPRQILREYEQGRFVRPSPLEAQKFHAWESVAWSHLPAEFEALDLSPVVPSGSVSALGPVSQDWVVSASRNLDVVSDVTNTLALECALRRRKVGRTAEGREKPVHLAASQRVVRAQHYDDPTQLSHFRLFALCSAGRDTGDLRFEREALTTHLRFYLPSLRAYLGPAVDLQVTLRDLADPQVPREPIRQAALQAASFDLGKVEWTWMTDHTDVPGYYREFRFLISARAPGEEWISLADGGPTDWTQKYLNNRKERLFISGLGSERLCTQFPRPPVPQAPVAPPRR